MVLVCSGKCELLAYWDEFVFALGFTKSPKWFVWCDEMAYADTEANIPKFKTSAVQAAMELAELHFVALVHKGRGN